MGACGSKPAMAAQVGPPPPPPPPPPAGAHGKGGGNNPNNGGAASAAATSAHRSAAALGRGGGAGGAGGQGGKNGAPRPGGPNHTNTTNSGRAGTGTGSSSGSSSRRMDLSGHGPGGGNGRAASSSGGSGRPLRTTGAAPGGRGQGPAGGSVTTATAGGGKRGAAALSGGGGGGGGGPPSLPPGSRPPLPGSGASGGGGSGGSGGGSGANNRQGRPSDPAAAASSSAGGGGGSSGMAQPSADGSDQPPPQQQQQRTPTKQNWVQKRLSATAASLPRVPSRSELLHGHPPTHDPPVASLAAGTIVVAPPYPTTHGGGNGGSGGGDPRWQALYAAYRTHISDPADVHSVLDEQISAMVNLLSPAEITLVQRRVRDVMGGILLSSKSSKGGGSGGGGGSKPKSALGRLTGGSKHRGGNGGSGNGSGSGNGGGDASPLRQDALDERSRAVYQKDCVLDEHAVRRVFAGGDRALARLYEEGVARGSRAVFVRRREAGRGGVTTTQSPSPPSAAAGGGSGGAAGGAAGGASEPTAANGTSPRRHGRGGGGGGGAAAPPPPPNADPVASAHVLMRYLSETRWDRVAAVAKVSADRAGLEMDVNKIAEQTTQQSQQQPQPPAAAPPPAPQFATAAAYGEAGGGSGAPPAAAPAGTTLTGLCYVLALALRGSRSQRLNLLYYLLLPPDQLRELLDAHCSGGVPTFLLETGEEGSSLVSYASLSHYYYYGGGLATSSLSSSSSIAGAASSPPPRRLLLSASRAIGCIASLLMDSLGGAEKGSGTHDLAAAAAAAAAASSSGDDTGATSRGGSLLAKSLAECRESKPKSYRRGLSLDVKEAIMDQFWSNSYALFDNPETADTTWSPDEFISWAENALCGKLSRKVGHDVVLEMITHRLFGTGILPTPTIERAIISTAWVSWQRVDGRVATAPGPNGDGEESWDDYLCNLGETLRGYVDDGTADSNAVAPPPPASLPWGGIGGLDGWGGLGRGVMYCIDRKWWDEWAAYVGWTWGDEDHQKAPKLRPTRPSEISTEALLANTSATWTSCPSGTLGSYEYMITDLARGRDYVLVPSAVWDLLYELYGGGPPLPRMVTPPVAENGTHGTKGNMINSVVADDYGSGVEVVAEHKESKPLRIPPQVTVATHPWILHCHICDPHQPYRRGDAGPVSIRIMATPDQPLWRLLGEIVVRLPVHHPKAKDASGLGRARLWKQYDATSTPTTAGGDVMSPPGGRYGPWVLLCKNRSACFPSGSSGFSGPDSIEFMRMDWLDYTDNSTVESAGLADGARIMFEYALMGKDGKFAWPREAAAKAGRVRQLADEETAFRLKLRNLSADGKLLAGEPSMLGKSVDAMDISGRWYKREILEVDTQDRPAEEGEGEGEGDNAEEEKQKDFIPGEVKAIRVDFTECGGHEEWIDVRSDRLAVAGRFTVDSDAETQSDEGGDAIKAAAHKLSSKEPSATELIAAGKICSFPGYGACGMTNLGNTCYANAALECVSYIPLLRSYLISGQYKVRGDLNKDNPLGTGGKVLEEFADLLRIMWSGKFGVRAPSKFRGQLAKAKSQYAGADQQDAQELLNDMLDILHEDSNKVVKKPYVEAPEDDWVKHTGLPRVGLEAWRRFLRRNRSVVADVAMGQVLNRVTCPVCQHESRNFDPFNMLSIPFPTVAEVIFRCRIIRRGSILNCPGTLGKNSDEESGAIRSKAVQAPPSTKLIVEEYVIPMSRLADVGDLRLRLQNISGISSNRLRLCKKEEVIVNAAAAKANDPSRTYVKVTPLPEKEGPCIQLARQLSDKKDTQTAEDVASPSITEIIAFESTLSPRPPLPSTESNGAASNGDLTDEETADEDDDEDITNRKEYQEKVARELQMYGNSDECRKYDTDPLSLSKAMSRSLWPKSSSDFRLGLRVDAIDHRSHWFPGSVVEIIDPKKNEGGTNNADEGKDDEEATKTKVRVHFDNFSSKWDETYTIDHFKSGKVRPLYSHATPKPKPTEFLVHHRHKLKSGNTLFGQPFYLQCHNEWSTARAGAHILAQASRFLQDNKAGRREPSDQFYQSSENARSVISQIIDMLLEADRKYVQATLKPITDKNSDGIRRTASANAMSQKLTKKLNALLPLLPFDVRVCTADSPLGGQQGNSSDEVAFPFSLVRTIGNYMNARHAVALHWREKATSKNPDRPRHPLLYMDPVVGVHERSKGVLEADAAAKAAGKNGQAHGGVQLGVCLDEFCKEQHLPETDSWRCPHCKDIREGKQHMILWRLPDILVFHLKRFNCSARWREKITTKVNFPLTGLNMSEWCDQESPFLEGSDESHVYDLIGVVNHYGGMTGGHYVATCKATPCGSDGSEEVAYEFNGAGINQVNAEEETTQSVWKGLGRSKEKDAANASSKAANAAARFVAESSEPLWLQFDDDLVDPIPPKQVVSEMAYVLFYRRRRISPANIAKYSVLSDN